MYYNLERYVDELRSIFWNLEKTCKSLEGIRSDSKISLLLDKIEKGVDLLFGKISPELYCFHVYFTCQIIHFEKHGVDFGQFMRNISILHYALLCPDHTYTFAGFDSEFKTVNFSIFGTDDLGAIKFPNHVLK